MFRGNAEKNKADIRTNLQLFETLIEKLPHQIKLGHSANRRIVSLFDTGSRYFFSCNKNARPEFWNRGWRESALRSSAIQSAPASKISARVEVVSNPRTREPAALPERTPDAASSATTQSAGATPRISAPFK